MPIRLTHTVQWGLIVWFIFFVIQQTGDRFFGTSLFHWLSLTPDGFFKQHYVWQILTYAFIHFDSMHLFFNLFMLGMIGSELEAIWGSKRLLCYAFFCSLTCGWVYVLLGLASQRHFYPLAGASGMIYGLLVAYGVNLGDRALLFMMIFPLKAKQLIWVLAVFQLLTTLYGDVEIWASLTHLTGMGAGFFYLWMESYWRRTSRLRRSVSRRQPRSASHLKLVIPTEKNPKIWH